MKPTTTLHDLGQSLWLDNVTRALLSSGTLQRYIDELSVTGLTSNPTIFDHAIKNSADYDADIARKAPSARSREESVLRAGAGGPGAGGGPVPSDLRADRRRRRLGVARGLASAGPRHRQHAGSCAQPPSARRQAQPSHQDSRHQGGPARHRSGDLRRHPDQRHAAVLARAIFGGGRRLSARRRAAHRGGAEPGRRLGRLALRQPMGCGRQRQGPGRADQPPRHCRRPARLQGLLRAARLAALPARRQLRRPGPALSLRQHRHQGPQGRRHALCGCARRTLHRQHHARGHPQGLCRPRRARRAARSRRRRQRGRLGRASPRPASTSTPWPRASRTRAPHPSSSPGTI